jgi:hypothetical protein
MRATSKSDVAALAAEVRAVPDRHAPAFAAAIVEYGMMIPQQSWVRIIIRIGMWRNRCGAGRVWLSVYTRKPEMARELIEQTADWIIHGKDRTDPHSAGGFNQAEVDKMLWLLSVTRAA